MNYAASFIGIAFKHFCSEGVGTLCPHYPPPPTGSGTPPPKKKTKKQNRLNRVKNSDMIIMQ